MEAKALSCPRCQSAVKVVAEALKDKPSPETLSAGGFKFTGLLDNIRSIHNVGSMFRTADGAGITQLCLAGITATPDHPRLAKAALGAQATVNWTYYPNGVDAALSLRDQGYHLCALERLSTIELPPIAAQSTHPEKLVLVVGNERAGIDPAIVNLCDSVLTLPMSGRKSSLNAAVAFGVGVYYLRFGNALAPHR